MSLDAEEDPGLLDELLLLLDDAPAALFLTQKTDEVAFCSTNYGADPWRPAGRRRSAKRLIASLRDEVLDLTDELARLRAQRRLSARDEAFDERRKRQRAETECAQLRDAVAAHSRFLRGLRTVFSAPPTLATGLDVLQFLHKHVKLPRDRTLRSMEYSVLADESRLQRATEMLCRETEALTIDGDSPIVPSVDEPYITTESTSDREGFQVASTLVYAVPTRDLGAAARGVSVAFRDSAIKCRGYTSTSVDGRIVDPDATTSLPMHIHYRVEGIHFRRAATDRDVVEGEGRGVALSKVTEDLAVLLWDFVDEDELHPIQETTDINRKATGSCLIRRELCADGVERAVCRALITRWYHFRQDAPREPLRRFETITSNAMRDCEFLFRSSILESIAIEEAAYAKAMEALRPRITDAALLDELLLLLGDAEDAEPLHEDPAPLLKPSKPLRSHLNPHKRLVANLQHEIAELSGQLEKLRDGVSRRRSPAQEVAQEARWKRRRAEDECERLRDAVAAQTRFIRGLRSVFSAPPSLARGLNGYRLLHKPTRLPRDRMMRRQEYTTLADESRLHRVVELLCRETESLTLADDEPLVPSLVDPYILNELTSDRSGFNVMATFVYAVPTRDLGAAARGIWVAFRDSSIKCCAYKSTSRDSHIVDPDTTTALPVSIQYRIEGIQYKNPQETDMVVGDSRTVTVSKETDESAIVLWDFVDDDELHPFQASADITRKAVGSCIIRREMCDDGVERAVCRGLFTRRFELCDGASPEPLEQFKDAVERHMRGCELLFRQSVIDSIETESALYASVLHALQSERQP